MGEAHRQRSAYYVKRLVAYIDAGERKLRVFLKITILLRNTFISKNATNSSSSSSLSPGDPSGTRKPWIMKAFANDDGVKSVKI